MDKTNLIDLDCTNIENYSKLVSPLIPNPVRSGDKYAPFICDAEYNNPFDKVLRNITNNDDPFERVYEIAYATPSNLHLVENDNKENYTHLVSPIQTPQRIRKPKLLSKNPIFLDKIISETNQKSLDVSINLHQSVNDTVNESDASLQCLSETFMNDFDGSFGVELPLPDTSNEQDPINNPSNLRNLSQNFNNNLTLPSINVYNENNYDPSDSGNSILNQAVLHSKSIENARMLKLSTKSSINSVINSNSFTLESTNELSNINRISSSSCDIYSDVNRAFLENKTTDSSTNMYTFNNQRKCLSAQKPSRKELNLHFPEKTKIASLNNSFSGFNLNNRIPSSYSLDDSVFLEARNLAHAFHNLANDTSELENEISVCAPPWMTDDIDLCDQDCEEVVELPTQNEVECPKFEVHVEEQKPDVKDDPELRNSSNLLHTLREFMKSDGNNVDERKLEENLLNSLAKALHLNTSGSNTTEDLPQEKVIGENGISAQNIRDNIQSSEELKNVDVKCVADENKDVKVVPKLKTQSIRLSTAPVKNLKAKAAPKGPLKAVIPLTNMAKTRRSVAPKVVIDSTTPSKSSQNNLSVFQYKRTSTPNEPKIKSPIAQSTPEVGNIKNHETDPSTPVKKRSFMYSLSPLARPASTTDLSGESTLNKSLSPKNISDSMPSNLNKSGSSLMKHGSNSSIPTSLGRRNSVGEKPDRSVLNRSYENNKPARPSLLKRSSSFQNKSTAQSSKTMAQSSKTIPDNNNVYKRFVPGMKLKLSNLGKK